MYGRLLDGELYTFGHEGVLYRNSFVMYDHQTSSLWVHTTGQAVKGELRGNQLEFLPSEVVLWRVWLDRHPETLVLDRGGEDEGFMGTFTLPEDTGDFGISVGRGTTATLFSFPRLQEDLLMEGEGFTLIYIEEGASVRAYATGSLELTWTDEGLASGEQRWDPLTGAAIAGDAEDLTRVPATVWLIDRWASFYRDGKIFE